MLGCELNSGALFYLVIICLTAMGKCQDSIEYVISSFPDNYSFQLNFYPKSVSNLLIDNLAVVQWNYSCSVEEPLDIDTEWIYSVMYHTKDAKVAMPVLVQVQENRTIIHEKTAQNQIKVSLIYKGFNSFAMKATGIGRTKMYVRLLREEKNLLPPTDILANNSNVTNVTNTAFILHEADYDVSVIRLLRLVDNVFRWVVAVTGVVTIFAVGCVTDLQALLPQFNKPGGLLIAVVTKALLLPPLSIGISKAFGMNEDITIGMLYTACIPSGGLGFFLTCASKGDATLGLTIHCMITFLSIGYFPMWVITLGSITKPISELIRIIQWFTVWLACSIAAFLLGIILRLFHVTTAETLLEWLIKPTLLLFSLVYITIGMYINSYAFALLDTMLMLTAGITLLPCCAFLLSVILGYLFRQESTCRRAISCEVSTFNGLLLLGMIHFSLPRLEADLAATVPLLVMLVTPIPFVLWYLGHKLKKLFSDKYNNNLNSMKNMERSRKNSVASSLINETNITNLSSSQSPQTPGSPIEENPEAGENDAFVDQVTVL